MAVPPVVAWLIRSPAGQRCSRCGHPFLARERPDAWWVLLCPPCQAEGRTMLVVLLVAFVVASVLVLSFAA